MDRGKYDLMVKKDNYKQLQDAVLAVIQQFREHVQTLTNALLSELRQPHQLLQTSTLYASSVFTVPPPFVDKPSLPIPKEVPHGELNFKRIQLLIDFLVKDLLLSELAAQTFLESRTLLLKETLDELSIRSDGDALIFTKYLSRLFFKDAISATHDHFKILFKEKHNPLLTKWILTQLEVFCKLMHTHVFKMQDLFGFALVAQAASIAIQYADKMSTKGIHVTYLLQNFFNKDLDFAARSYTISKMEELEKLIQKEAWNGAVKTIFLTDRNKPKSTKKGEAGDAVFLTDSGSLLFEMVSQLLKMVEPIASNEFYRM